MKMYVLTMTKAMKNRAYQELKSNAGILEKGTGIAAFQTDKSEPMRKQTTMWISKCCFGLPDQTHQIKAKSCISSLREHFSSAGFSPWFVRP